ncbi:unnamed protein product, partial [Tetraodon nigroviridis]
LDGDCAAVAHSFPQMKPHPGLLAPSRNSGVDHGALVLGTEVCEVPPLCMAISTPLSLLLVLPRGKARCCTRSGHPDWTGTSERPQQEAVNKR